MSDEISSQEKTNASSEQDPLKQIKSEFGRKQDNVMKELDSLKSQLSQIADTVIHAAAVKRNHEENREEDIDPVLDPKGYKESLKRNLKEELRSEMNQSLSAERERNNTLGLLVSQYPELQQSDSELTKTALNIYNNLSATEKASPSGYKVAVMQAAQEVGLLPINKRRNQVEASEDFTMSSSNSTARRPSQKAKENKIDDKTLEFARLLGRPVEDEKYIEKLKSTITNRKRSWSRFE